MPADIVPLVGHHRLRDRLAAAVARSTLPGSLLLHGPSGIGKQRVALWLAQLLLCQRARTSTSGDASAPCGQCQACRYSLELIHPDLKWVFPQPRDADADVSDVWRSYADAVAKRVDEHLLYPAPSGAEAIYRVVVQALVQAAALTPALGRRKVLVVGEADRMVSQTGAEEAANAFLKLLEEPPEDTTIILTSSAPGALLPTVRSRLAPVHVSALTDDDVRAWLRFDRVREHREVAALLRNKNEDPVRKIAGAPGHVLQSRSEAVDRARQLLNAARGSAPDQVFAAALQLGATGARGTFAPVLTELAELLGEEMRQAIRRGDFEQARASATGIENVEWARERADNNAIPQLVGAELVRLLASRN